MYQDKEAFKEQYIKTHTRINGKSVEEGSCAERYKALATLIINEINTILAENKSKGTDHKNKFVYYFSMEFLIGKQLKNYLTNMGILDLVNDGLDDLGISLEDLEECEHEPGLGNGGLGRLAACFLDSMSYLNIPGNGNGIRYKYGLFEQRILDGYQIELPDNWLKGVDAWEIRRNEESVIVKYYGQVKVKYVDNNIEFIHENYEPVLAVPYDTPMVGYNNFENINNLRLWSAEPVQDFDFKLFNEGNFLKSVQTKTSIEAISQILYPNDSTYKGKELRLKQQYFFVSAGLQSIVKKYINKNGSIKGLNKSVSIHINDTHPALCIPELMRILMDKEGFTWDEAWKYTVEIMSYTNHTVLPEALEKWPIPLMKKLLPRIYMIIEEIHKRFEGYLKNINMSDEEKNKMLILYNQEVYMTNLAVVGSSSVNGVAKLHTKILKRDVFKEFNTIFPGKFNNKTNGVSHRRFLLQSNPRLSKLLNELIGDKWIKEPERLIELIRFKDDKVVKNKLREVKKYNKKRLADYIQKKYSIRVDINSIFDIQVKRIHAYKRQLLNALHVLHLYNQIIENPNINFYPRTFIFAGKAAPGYHFAKKIIKLINSIAEKVNNSPINNLIKVIYLENFNVSLGEIIYPTADISEQISATGKEASGTGNMKFMMNGGITLGTMDGANIEICEKVGRENMFVFGLALDEVDRIKKENSYRPYEIYKKDKRIQYVLDQILHGFRTENTAEFQDIYNSLLLHNDEYFVLKDFDSYTQAHKNIMDTYKNKDKWFDMVIKNIAYSGYFSSDRTVTEYAKEIWK